MLSTYIWSSSSCHRHAHHHLHVIISVWPPSSHHQVAEIITIKSPESQQALRTVFKNRFCSTQLFCWSSAFEVMRCSTSSHLGVVDMSSTCEAPTYGHDHHVINMSNITTMWSSTCKHLEVTIKSPKSSPSSRRNHHRQIVEIATSA